MAGTGAISKPSVFLSHAATDQPIAQVIHGEITRMFGGGVTVYASSVPGIVKPGQDWLDSIEHNLSAAHAVIVIITPVSLSRPWIWFEVGASWSKMREGKGLIIPVCYEVEKSDLPEPLGRLQAMSLCSARETKQIFQALVDRFEFGSLKGFRHSTISAKLPRYRDLTISAADIGSGTIYDGPYQGYSDDELAEVLEEVLVRPAFKVID